MLCATAVSTAQGPWGHSEESGRCDAPRHWTATCIHSLIFLHSCLLVHSQRQGSHVGQRGHLQFFQGVQVEGWGLRSLPLPNLHLMHQLRRCVCACVRVCVHAFMWVCVGECAVVCMGVHTLSCVFARHIDNVLSPSNFSLSLSLSPCPLSPACLYRLLCQPLLLMTVANERTQRSRTSLTPAQMTQMQPCECPACMSGH